MSLRWDTSNRRLSFDGFATIITVCLGYAGFVHVFVSEGKRHIGPRRKKPNWKLRWPLPAKFST